MMTLMVINGFSLLEIRKLYIDEFHIFYEQLFYNLEKLGKVKDGTYDKIKSSKNGTQVENTVNDLRRQMFRSIADKNKIIKRKK